MFTTDLCGANSRSFNPLLIVWLPSARVMFQGIRYRENTRPAALRSLPLLPTISETGREMKMPFWE